MKINILKSFNEKQKIKQFLEKLFSKRFSLEEFENIILNPRFGNPYLIISESESEIIGSMNLLPRKFNGLDFYLMTSTGVLENFRKTGAYLEMLEQAKEISRKEKKPIFAFPNQNAYLPLVKIFGFREEQPYEIVMTKKEALVQNSSDLCLVEDKIKSKTYYKYMLKKTLYNL